MFGPKSPKELIFLKTKEWWELMHKIHLPEERKNLNDDELMDIAKHMSELRVLVRNLELNNKISLDKMVDFEKLTKIFFLKNKYSYGVPLKKDKEASKE